jgi:phosphate/sulfate permease
VATASVEVDQLDACQWVLTLPAAILLSGSLYWLFTHLL